MATFYRRTRLTAGAAALALGVAACTLDGYPSAIYTPELVGPIESIEHVSAENLVTVRGRVIEVSDDSPRALRADGLLDDALFLYGEDNASAWYVVIGRDENSRPPGCYGLTSSRAFDAGEHVVIGIGPPEALKLRKAPGFNSATPPDPESGRYAEDYWCLNERGEVVNAV